MKNNVYLKVENFNDFCTNQNKLIEILNHRMTSMEEHVHVIKNDIGWAKKIMWAIFGVVALGLIENFVVRFLGV